MSEEIKRVLKEFNNFADSKGKVYESLEKRGHKLSDNEKRERDYLRETAYKRSRRDKEHWGD